MPDANHVPRYCKHKGTGQAVVRLSGKDHYLGKYGSAASKAEYDRLTKEWLDAGRQLPSPERGLTVNEVLFAFVSQYAIPRYGKRSKEFGCQKDAFRVVKELFGTEPASEFGPKRFKAFRKRFVSLGWSRRYANRQAQRVRRAFAWAVEEELLPGTVFHSLLAVKGLLRGDPGTRETEPVRPVPNAFVEAVKAKVAPQVQAMIELQALTAMRPGEVCMMRGCDLETSGNVWVYRPEHHKTEHHGQTREIYIGPKAKEVLKPWLRPNLQEYVFRPEDAMAWRFAQRRQGRQTPRYPSHVAAKIKDKQARNRRHYCERYDTESYRNAIYYGCHAAQVPQWSPNRLRHNAATALRKQFGIELARIVLGHSTAFTTEIYAEADKVQAMEVMARVG